MECTQQKFALEMTREWSFLLSLSKKWPKNYVSKMGHSDPGISFFREGVWLATDYLLYAYSSFTVLVHTSTSMAVSMEVTFFDG